MQEDNEVLEIKLSVNELINNELMDILTIFDKIDKLDAPTLYKITIKLKWFLFLTNYFFCKRCNLSLNKEDNLIEISKKCFFSKDYDIFLSIKKIKKLLTSPHNINDMEVKEINAIIDIPHFGFYIYVPFNKTITSYIQEYIDYKLKEIKEIKKSVTPTDNIDKDIQNQIEIKKELYEGLDILSNISTKTKHLKEYIKYYDFYSKLVNQLSLLMKEIKVPDKKRVILYLINKNEEMPFEVKNNNYKSLCSRILYKLETGDYIESNRSKKHVEKIDKLEKIIKAIPYM